MASIAILPAAGAVTGASPGEGQVGTPSWPPSLPALDLPRWDRSWDQFTVLCPMGQVSPGGRPSWIRLLPQSPNRDCLAGWGLCPACLCQSLPVQLGSDSRTNGSAAPGQAEEGDGHPRRALARAHLPTWTPVGAGLPVWAWRPATSQGTVWIGRDAQTWACLLAVPLPGKACPAIPRGQMSWTMGGSQPDI